MSPRILVDDAFIGVQPRLARALTTILGINPQAAFFRAALVQHLHFRTGHPAATVIDGDVWYPVNRDDLADEMGVTRDVIRAGLNDLRAAGIVRSAQLPGFDRTLHFRVDVERLYEVVIAHWGDAPQSTGGPIPNPPLYKNLKKHVDPADRRRTGGRLDEDLLAEITAALEGHGNSEWIGDKGRSIHVTDVSALLDDLGTRLVRSGRVSDPTAYLRPIVRKANYPEAMKVALVNAYYLAEAS